MKNLTLYLPGFSHRLCGRRAQAGASRLGGKADTLDGLVALVAQFIPAETFTAGSGQRERVFTPWVTFITFLEAGALARQFLSRGSAASAGVERGEQARAAR
jgi:hypothetical protein